MLVGLWERWQNSLVTTKGEAQVWEEHRVGGQAVRRWQGGWASWGQGRDLRAMLGLALGLDPQPLSVRL